MILTIRTDKPDAEIGLFDGVNKVAYDTWTAHRKLGETLHLRLEVFLQATGTEWDEITGIVFYEGPGSFTGLRIGASVVNALAYSYDLAVANSSGEDWISQGIELLKKGGQSAAVPFYGSEPFTTAPRK